MPDEDDVLASLTGSFGAHVESVTEKLEGVIARLDAITLLVVVFGAGRGNTLHYRKRQQIRNELRRIPGVSAFFPEEHEFKEIFKDRFGISGNRPDLEEVLQVEAADLVIALEPGAGVEQEVAIFSRVPRYAQKMLCLIEEKHRDSVDSFAGIVRRSLEKEYYSPEDFQSCKLATITCPQRVRERKVQRLYLS